MGTLTVTGKGNRVAPGATEIHRIEFATTGAATLTLDDDQFRHDLPGVLSARLIGSDHVDELVIRMTQDARLNLMGLDFSMGWSAAQDRVSVLDTLGSNIIRGSDLTDRIVLTGGDDTVYGRGGQDTLVLDYGTSTERFVSSAGRIASGESGSVLFSGIERLEATFGRGADAVHGLAGDDILSGRGGRDLLAGRGGADSLFGGMGDDSLLGQAGNDLLDGGAGNDTLRGGAGDDTYVLDSLQDKVVELADGGTDTIQSTRSVTLADMSVENGQLLGTLDADILGSETGNILGGNLGANVLSGLGGRDDLRVGGDAARDTISYGAASESTGADRDLVRGFDATGEDSFAFHVAAGSPADLARAVALTEVASGALNAASFDADVAAAVDGALTPGGDLDAALWDPLGGDLDATGRRFLVVDWDNDGSYKAGKDFVVELTGLEGGLDAGDLVLIR